jgi:hypothetical protein
VKACEAVQDLLAGHVLEALDVGESALVEEHLAGCEICQASRAESAECIQHLSAPPATPPPLVWKSIKARIERTGGDDPVRDTAHADPVISLSCSYCRGVMTRTGAVYCASCLAPHHPECFAEYGRCSVMGCGERQIVRPAELAPLVPARSEPPPSPRQPRRLSRGWIALALAACTGVGAAAYTLRGDPQQAQLAPRLPHDRSGAGQSLFQVNVAQATVDEVVAAIEKEAGVRVVIAEGAENFLVRSGSWRSRTWKEVLNALTRDLPRRQQLHLEHGPKGNVLGPRFPAEFEYGPDEAPTRVTVDRTELVTSHGVVEQVWEGLGQRVVAAPNGEGVAVLGSQRLRLYEGRTQVGSTSSPVSAVAWSAQGDRLCYLKRSQGGQGSPALSLGFFDLRRNNRRAQQTSFSKLPDLDPSTQVAWLDGEDTILVRAAAVLCKVNTVTGQVVSLKAPSPSGYRRFNLRSLGNRRFLVEKPDRIEVWRSKGSVKLESSYPLPPGYTTSTSPLSKLGLVRTSTEILSFPVGSVVAALESRHTRETLRHGWQASLSRCGRWLACLDGDEGYLRPLDDPEGDLVLLRSDSRGSGEEPLRGLVWGGEERIAFWTAHEVYTLDAKNAGSRRPFKVHEVEAGRARILSVVWSGPDLVLTARLSVARRSNVRVARVD